MTTQRETPLLHSIRAYLASESDVTVWRSNTGVDVSRGVRYGLGIGSADLIGILHPYGRWLSFEVKTAAGRQTPEQRAWERTVQRAGGFYAVVRNVEQARAALSRARAGALT